MRYENRCTHVGGITPLDHICKEENTRWLKNVVRSTKTRSRKLTARKEYAVKDAVQLVKDIAYADFDSTIEVAFNKR